MTKKVNNLVFLMRDDDILLAMKKRGFGEGKWNGLGGKIRGDETIEVAALREIEEEASIRAAKEDLEKRAVITFHSPKMEDIEMHVYRLTEWQGDPAESEEMKPQWYSIHDIPFTSMWADDPYWLPKFIAGEMFVGEFWFDENDAVTHHTITPMTVAELSAFTSTK